jgi:ATP-binding cassette subfamily B protein
MRNSKSSPKIMMSKKVVNNFERPKTAKGSLKKLISYLKPYYKLIIISLVLATISSVLTIIGPDNIKELTNEILNGLMKGINFTKVRNITIFLVSIYLISALFNYFQGFIMATVTNKFSKKLRNEIATKINKMPLKYFDSNTYGDILSRVTNDVYTISQTMNNSVASLLGAIVLFVGVTTMMFITNWQMALTGILATLIGFILMMVILSKSQKYFNIQQNELGKMNGHIEEVYSGHNVVKVYNGIKDANQKFDDINDKLFVSSKKSQFLSGLMQPIMAFIGNFGYVAICIVGAMLVIDNKITIGTIVAFMIYVRIFTNPLATIAQAATQLQSTAAASERVFAFLGEEEMTKEEDKVLLKKTDTKGNVIFDHVKFGYNKNKKVIKDFSVNIKSGQKIAIVGPTGAGKTTLVNLLMKFYEINSGDIKLDGISIHDLKRENIHELFSMVLQDTWLFGGTIKENIIYNQKGITDKEVKEACQIVGLDHFIKTLPDGYDTVINDADSISAGQKQLLTIARSMLEKAPLIILDEATSSVDTRTEELVQKAMDKLTVGRTSFVIAHRLSTIKNADLILVLKDGDIVEQGNHDELIKKNGFYAELYNAQFQN